MATSPVKNDRFVFTPSPKKVPLKTKAEVALKQLPMTPIIRVTEEDKYKHGDEIPYKEYDDDLEYGAVFNKLDSLIVDIRTDEKHMKYRIGCSFCSWFCCALGIFIILYSTATTPAFSSQKPIFWLFCLGCSLEVPCLFWFCAFFCVSRDEWNRRQDIRKKRKQRLKEFKGDRYAFDTKFQEEVKAQKVQRAIAAKEVKYEIAVAQRNVVLQNPMGYPSTEKTRKGNSLTLHTVKVQPKDDPRTTRLNPKKYYEA